MSRFTLVLKETFEKINSLYSSEFELDGEQKEFAETNVVVDLVIACEAIAQHKGVTTNSELEEEIKKLPIEFSQAVLNGKTNNTFKLCSSKDEASKLFLELTKLGIAVDPQDLEHAECEKQVIVQGLCLIRSQKYISFILSARETLGFQGAIAMKIAQDTLGKEEGKMIYDELKSIISEMVDQVQ